MDNYDNDDDAIPNMDDNNYYDTLVEFLTDNDAMRKTAVGSVKQGLMAGGGAVTGGLLLGPVGGLLGGIVGSILGFWQAPDYAGLVHHIADLPESRRNKLLQAVRISLLHAGANTSSFGSPQLFKQTLLQFAGQRQVRDQIWKACVDALEDDRQ